MRHSGSSLASFLFQRFLLTQVTHNTVGGSDNVAFSAIPSSRAHAEHRVEAKTHAQLLGGRLSDSTKFKFIRNTIRLHAGNTVQVNENFSSETHERNPNETKHKSVPFLFLLKWVQKVYRSHYKISSTLPRKMRR